MQMGRVERFVPTTPAPQFGSIGACLSGERCIRSFGNAERPNRKLAGELFRSPPMWDAPRCTPAALRAELTLRGYVNERGRPFSVASIAAMLATRPPGGANRGDRACALGAIEGKWRGFSCPQQRQLSEGLSLRLVGRTHTPSRQPEAPVFVAEIAGWLNRYYFRG